MVAPVAVEVVTIPAEPAALVYPVKALRVAARRVALITQPVAVAVQVQLAQMDQGRWRVLVAREQVVQSPMLRQLAVAEVAEAWLVVLPEPVEPVAVALEAIVVRQVRQGL
jgi:hypothetical protein